LNPLLENAHPADSAVISCFLLIVTIVILDNHATILNLSELFLDFSS
jgi:hypothetical protein